MLPRPKVLIPRHNTVAMEIGYSMGDIGGQPANTIHVAVRVGYKVINLKLYQHVATMGRGTPGHELLKAIGSSK